jgi:alpha-amylase/alpha-mannosidase (GH57 family)
MTEVYHALGLHMHQPPGNLRLLSETNEWEAQQIIRCYESPLHYAQKYKKTARLHIGFSGVLLDQFSDPSIVDRYRQITRCKESTQIYPLFYCERKLRGTTTKPVLVIVNLLVSSSCV